MADEEVQVEEEVIAPEPLSLTDDQLIAFEEGADPISWADLRKGYSQESAYTQKSQALAEERKQWEQTKAQYEKELRDYVTQVQQFAQAPQQQQQVNPVEAILENAMQNNGGIVTVDDLKQLLPIIGQQMAPINDITEALGLLNNRMNEFQGPLGEILQSRQQRETEKMMNSFFDANDIPQDAREMAQEVFMDFYRANEPTPEEAAAGKTMATMWNEFAGSRLQQVLQLAEAITKGQASQAEAKLLRKGPTGSPSAPVKPPMTVEEIMDAVNPSFPEQ